MDKGIFIIIGIVIVVASLSYLYYKVEYPEVALIHIDGTIDSNLYQDIYDEVNKANESAKGFIFEINSPGGYVVPSERLANLIKSLHKPTVCLVDDAATSGAYWVATSCDYIVADKYSIVGSIGVTSSYLEFSDFMKKYGIDYVRIVSGEEKDMGSPYRKPTPQELEYMKNITMEIRDEFVKQVAINRGLNYSYVSNLSDGRIFTGKEALKLGLIDYIGDMDTAKGIMEKELNSSNIRIVEYGRNPIEELLMRDLANAIVEKLFSDYKIKIMT